MNIVTSCRPEETYCAYSKFNEKQYCVAVGQEHTNKRSDVNRKYAISKNAHRLEEGTNKIK